MAPHRTFFLVPADAVTQSTIATPRPLAPSPRVVSTLQYVMKPVQSEKRPLSADAVEMLIGEPSQPHQRKRECLDHLTHEQKLNRRKMKNRIAAQTARDRKKYRNQRLEDVIRELLEQNEALKQENEMLRIANDDLTERNRCLMATFSSSCNDITCRVESKQPVDYDEMHYEMTEDSGKAIESAAFISGPLPRVQVVPLYLLPHLVIILMVVCYSHTNSGKYSTTSPMRTLDSTSTKFSSNCQMSSSSLSNPPTQNRCASQLALPPPSHRQRMRVS